MKKTLYLPIDTTFNFVLETPYNIKIGDILSFRIALFDRGVAVDLEGQTVQLTLKKPDGKYIERNYSSLTGNELYINDLDVQATIVAGEVKGEITVFDENGESISNTFTYIVKNSISDDAVRESEDDVKTLQQLRQLILKYEVEMQAIGTTVDSIDAFASIKAYIDTNLEELKSNNANAASIISNLQDQNIQAVKNIEALSKIGDATELAKKVQNNTSQLNARMKSILAITNKITSATSDKKINIKFIGDSITAGVGGTGYNLNGDIIYGTHKINTSGHCFANNIKSYLESKFNCNVKNFGIGGITSQNIVSNLSSLISENDNIVVCMIGTNNRHETDGVNVLKNDLKTIYNYVKNLGNEIIFMSSIPTTDENEIYTYKMDDIDNAVMSVCSQLGIEYISLFKLFAEYCESRSFGMANLLSDGVHPNDNGYDALTYIILNKFGIGYKKSIDIVANEILLKSGDDLNDIFTPNVKYYTDRNVTVPNILNIPKGLTLSFSLEFIKTATLNGAYKYGVQKLTDIFGNIYIRCCDNSVWQDWVKVIDVKNSDFINIPLTDGVTNYEDAQYRLKNKEVTLRGRIGNVTTNSKVIGVLPDGYRPAQTHFYTGFMNGYIPVGIFITTSGEITVGTEEPTKLKSDNYISLATKFDVK